MTSISSQLISRNVTIAGHRTSIRLEAHMWEAFDEICQREGLSAHELCAMIDEKRHNSSRTAAVRAFAVHYFRTAATDQGHAEAGHGLHGKSLSFSGVQLSKMA